MQRNPAPTNFERRRIELLQGHLEDPLQEFANGLPAWNIHYKPQTVDAPFDWLPTWVCGNSELWSQAFSIFGRLHWWRQLLPSEGHGVWSARLGRPQLQKLCITETHSSRTEIRDRAPPNRRASDAQCVQAEQWLPGNGFMCSTTGSEVRRALHELLARRSRGRLLGVVWRLQVTGAGWYSSFDHLRRLPSNWNNSCLNCKRCGGETCS
mmetsp:Transcript_16848/g.58797  ORF Transcript_16848/g.58797 Transcript_16848/m.58797 type:complete len:209 (-) Transcript_16848:1777-2403(-)